jgi:hypothetical protein
MPQIIKAWAIAQYSPLQLSQALRRLNISHSVVGQAPDRRVNVLRVDGLATEQPAWPVIYHSVADCRRFILPEQRQVHLVCDSSAVLSMTNLSTWLWTSNIERDLKKILVKRDIVPFVLQVQEKSYMDFVDVASKPSFLRLLQTAFYKIVPYADQKAIRIASLSYLGGGITKKALERVLSITLKSEKVRELLASDTAQNLMSAAALARQTGDIEASAEQFNIDAFEVRYILSTRES